MLGFKGSGARPGGLYPNGGVLNQITDKRTCQNPETLNIVAAML